MITGAGEAFCAGQDIRLYFREAGKDPAAAAVGARQASASGAGRSSRPSRSRRSPWSTAIASAALSRSFAPATLPSAADEAIFGLSEVNWGILPGGIVCWNVVQVMNYRDALYYAMTGDTFDGKKAKEMGLVNFSVPKAELRERQPSRSRAN